MNPVIVSGIGRSGTGYVAEVLRRCGLRAKHEAVFRGGAPAKPPHRQELAQLDVEVSGFAMPHLSEPEFRNLPVVLCVRHPLDWLASWQKKRYAATYLSEHLAVQTEDDWISSALDSTFPPIPTGETPSGKDLLIWAYWTLAVAERAVFFFQVEHLRQIDVEAIALLGGMHDKLDTTRLAKSMFRVPRSINSTRERPRTPIDWSDITALKTKRLARAVARRFGYR